MSEKIIKTLSVGSNFFTNSDSPDKELDEALSLSIFDRCELTLQSSNGENFLESQIFYNKLLNCLEVIRKHGLSVILSVSAYENKMNYNSNICVYQANRNGRERILTRICPGSLPYRKKLCDIVIRGAEELLIFPGDSILLSYFRYENFNQCVCDDCLKRFAQFVNERGKLFVYNNIFDLLNKKIMLDWIEWKQKNINQALYDISSSLNKPIIVEIDFDLTKCYLSGPFIEEGLNINFILPIVSELYLHIEPCKPFSALNFLDRVNQKNIYLNNLKYIINLGKLNKTSVNFFFWFLSTEEQIKSNLKYYLELTYATSPHGAVFFTYNPLLLSRYFYNQLL